MGAACVTAFSNETLTPAYVCRTHALGAAGSGILTPNFGTSRRVLWLDKVPPGPRVGATS